MSDESAVLENESPPKIKRKPRKRVTLTSHLKKYDDLLEYLDAEIDHKARHKEKGIKSLQTIRKKVRELQRETPKISSEKRRNTSGKPRKSGFASRYQITDELLDFMQLPPKSTPTLNEITNAIYIYIKLKPGEKRPQMLKWQHLNPDGRDLQNPDNRTTVLPDEKLSGLLGYEDYRQEIADGKVTINRVVDKRTREKKTVVMEDDSLFYWTIQRLIQKQIIKSIKSPPKKE